MTSPIPITDGYARVGKRYYRAADAQNNARNGTAQGLDYFSNAAARMGWGTASIAEATEYDLVRLSLNYWLLVTLYRNHWISRRIVDGPAQDMVRAWPRLTSGVDPKDLTRIDRALRETNTKSNLLKAMKWARLFGGAGALIVIDGHENRLDEPLDLEMVEPGSYRGVIPFDRWTGISPDTELSTDLSKPLLFNLPKHYSVSLPGSGSFRVHASRILKFNGPSVPTPEYEAQNYWGISVLEPAYEEIRKRDNLSWNILSVSFRANLISINQPDLEQAMSGASMSQTALVQFEQRMQAMNRMLSNQSMLILPKDGNLQSVSQSMAGWADVYQQFQLDIAGAAQIPVTRLFGRTLSGLGQSNDADERIYEEYIALEQDDQLRPQLDALYPVICMSKLGEVPEDLELTFPSIRVLDEKEKADLAKTTTDSVMVLVSGEVFSKSLALKELRQSSDATGFGTNISDADIQAAEDEESLGIGGFGEERRGPLDVKHPVENLEGKESSAGAKDSVSVRDLEFAGIPISVEYEAGTRRILKNPAGAVVYDRVLQFPYGFIRNTTGRDGDEIDVILGTDENAPNVYVIDMIDLGPDVHQREDEDKVFVGFKSPRDVKAAFLTMYPASFLGGMDSFGLQEFRTNWIERNG